MRFPYNLIYVTVNMLIDCIWQSVCRKGCSMRKIHGKLLIFITLMVAMMVSAATVAVADETYEPTAIGVVTITEDHAVMNSAAGSADDEFYYTNVKDAGAFLRTRMMQRETLVEIPYTRQGRMDYDLLLQIVQEALQHTGCAGEGDNLYYQLKWYSYGYHGRYNNVTDITKGIISVNCEYMDTLEQEQALESRGNEILKSLNLNGKSDSYKISAIYNYLCKNVEYKYSDDTDWMKYTAYDALVNGTAVCQGYANAFYFLLCKAGVDSRIVTGFADNGESHAWNIVQYGKSYFQSDSTWDVNHTPALYFMRGSRMERHILKDTFTTETFAKQYPIPNTDAELLQIPDTPEVTAKTDLKSVTLNWKQVTNAYGYYIYRTDADGTGYSFLGGTRRNTYTDTTIDVGHRYFYKVVAFTQNSAGEQQKGGYSKAVGIRPVPGTTTVTELKQESATAITLTWTTTPYVKGYIIYRADATGTFRYLAATLKTSYTDKTLKSGSTYRYKIVPYCKDSGNANVEGTASAIVANERKAAPAISQITAVSSGKIRLTLTGGKAGTVYRIYRCEQGGTYTCVGTANGTTFTDTGLTKGTTYFYKITAVETIGNTRYETEKSSFKAAKAQ